MKNIALIVVVGAVLIVSSFFAGLRVEKSRLERETWSIVEAERNANYRDAIRIHLSLLDFGERMDADTLVLNAERARLELRQRDAKRDIK